MTTPVVQAFVAIVAAATAIYTGGVIHRFSKLSDDWCCKNLDNDFVAKVLQGTFVLNIMQFFLMSKWAFGPYVGVHSHDISGHVLDSMALAAINIGCSIISFIFASFINKLMTVDVCRDVIRLADKYRVLELMTNGVGTFVWSKDSCGRLSFVNKVACDFIFSGNPRDIIGMDNDQLNEAAHKRHPRYTFIDIIKAIEAHIISDRVPMRVLMVGCVGDCGIWIVADVTPSFDAHGNYIGYVCLGRDVTYKCDKVADDLTSMLEKRRAKAIRSDLYMLRHTFPEGSDCESVVDEFNTRFCVYDKEQ